MKKILLTFISILFMVQMITMVALANETETMLETPEITVSYTDEGDILIQWQPIEGAVEYEVSHGGPYESYYRTTEETSYVDSSGFDRGTIWKYSVTAIGNDGTRSETSDKREIFKLDDSFFLRIMTDQEGMLLSCGGEVDIYQYDLYCSETMDGEFEKIATLLSNDQYAITLEKGDRFYYYGIAKDSEGNVISKKTSIVSAEKLYDISNFKGKNVASSGKTKLTWDALEAAEKYVIKRGAYGEGFEIIKTTTALSFTDSTALFNKHYNYVIYACNEKGEIISEEAVVEDMRRAPAKPVVSVGKDEETNETIISWEPVEGAERFEIVIDECEDGCFSTTDNYYKLGWLSSGMNYHITVQAVTEDGLGSAVSKKVTVKLEIRNPGLIVGNDTRTGKVLLELSGCEKTEEFEIYRATSKKGTFSKIATTDERRYVDKTAKDGKTYYYYAIAVGKNGSIRSGKSEVISGKNALVVSNFTAKNVASTGEIKLTWDSAKGAEKYVIYRGTEESAMKKIKTTISLSYTDKSAKFNIGYRYAVYACDSSGNILSVENTIDGVYKHPARPVVTKTYNKKTGECILKWDAVEGAVHYRICYDVVDDTTFIVTKNSYKVKYISPGKEFHIRVYAETDNGESSAASKEVAGSVKVASPDVTIGNDRTSGKVRLEWNYDEYVAKYDIYRATSKNGSYSKIATVQGLWYVDKTAKDNKTYYYYVIAKGEKKAGDSYESDVQSGKNVLASPEIHDIRNTKKGAIKVSWNKVTGAKKYVLYRKDPGSKKFTKITTTTSLSYVDSGLKSGTYEYYLVAKSSDGKKTSLNGWGVEFELCKLTPPKVSVSYMKDEKITLNWECSNEVKKYEIYRSTSKNGTYKKVGEIGQFDVDEFPFVDNTAVPNKAYYYKVVATSENKYLKSDFSKVVSKTAKLSKAKLKVEDNNNGKFKLVWNKVEGAVKYEVYRRVDEDLIKIATTTKLNCVVNHIKNKSFSYVVVAVASNKTLNSTSNEEIASFKVTAPKISASKTSAGIKISWKDVPYGDEYAIYRSTSKNGTYTRLKWTESLSYVDKTAKKGKTYYYYVIADANAEGTQESDPSNIVKIKR